MSSTSQHIQTYLDKYTVEERKQIQTAYEAERIKFMESALKVIVAMSANGLGPIGKKLVMTAAAPGTGTTTHMEQFVKQEAAKGNFYVLLDPDNYRGRFPTGHTLAKDINAEFGAVALPKGFQEGVDEAISQIVASNNHWRKAQMYIRDSLACEARKIGLPIALVTSAHSPRIESFLRDVRSDGYSIEMHICDTTLETKLAANSHRQQSGSQVSEADIKRKDANVGNNMFTYAHHADVLHILWRNGEKDKLKTIAISEGCDSEAKILDERAMARFDANRPASPVYHLLSEHIGSCAERKRAKTLKHRSTLQQLVDAPGKNTYDSLVSK